MLKLSDGCRRYVVAYTIKPSPVSKKPDPQPDILNASGKVIPRDQTKVTVTKIKKYDIFHLMGEVSQNTH